jgi:hypothetical protein
LEFPVKESHNKLTIEMTQYKEEIKRLQKFESEAPDMKKKVKKLQEDFQIANSMKNQLQKELQSALKFEVVVKEREEVDNQLKIKNCKK